MLAMMDEASVDHAILLGWYWEQEATCRWHNEVIATWVAQAPDRFSGFAAILPNENVIAQLEHAQELGLRGVGELHPGVQGFRSQSQRWQTLARWCAEHGWPVNFHTTARGSRDHPSAVPTPLSDYLTMARQAPDLKMILAHWGGGLATAEHGPLPSNLFFDCAASPLLYEIGSFRAAIEHVGREQALFGSDFPLRIYPRKQKRADMARFLEEIKNEARLSREEQTMFLGGNCARLLKL